MDLAYLATMPLEEFVERRQRVFDQMEDNATAVLFSATELYRNSDNNFPFRQESHFWYLTNFNEPDSILVLVKKAGVEKTYLFLRPNDPLMETWNGRRLGVDKAPEVLKITQAFDVSTFKEAVLPLIQGTTHLYRITNNQPWAKELEDFLCALPQFQSIHPFNVMLDEMRLFKSKNEIALMQQAAQITAFGHLRAMRETRPNRMEYELEGEMRYEYSRHGSRFVSFNAIVAGGENACILHYTENDNPLKDGDLVLVDAGAEFAMYAGDITRTYPVNGKFTEAQKDIYQLVLDVQKHAIEMMKPGRCIQDANDAVVRMMVEGLVKLGIMQGDVDELIKAEAYREFYMHGLGHWLGLDTHDVGSYAKDSLVSDRNNKNRDRVLEPGMVLTVEPGLYISEKSNAPEKYKGIGVRIEDDILITETGNKVLTSAVMKEIEEIEAYMAK